MVSINTKTLFTIIAVLFISFLSINTAKADSDLCGMRYTATDGTQVFPYEVKDRSFEVCDEDISYKMLYMLFGNSMESSLGQEIFHLFHKPDDATLIISDISPIGRVMSTIYESFSYLFFSVFIVVLGVQTIRYIYTAQQTGNFLGDRDGNANAAKVATISLLVILLATPIGSVLLIQGIIISLAVPAIQMANFFLSGFLSNVQTETTRVEFSDELIRMNSDNYATEQVFGQLCEDQTQQAIINSNYISGSSYRGGFFRRLFNRNQNPMEYLQLCNTYTDTLDTNNTGFLTSITSEIRYQQCDFHRNLPRVYRFRGSSFGSNHQCTTLNFKQPDNMLLSNITTNTGNRLKEETLNEILKDKNENGQYFSQFGFMNILNKVITTSLRSELITLSDKLRNQSITEDEYNEELIEILNRQAETFKNQYLIYHRPVYQTIGEGENERQVLVSYEAHDNTGGLLSIDINDAIAIGNNSEVFSLIYMRHLSALNKALGGYVMPIDSNYEANRFAIGSGIGLKNKRYERDIKKLYKNVDNSGLEHLRIGLNVRETSRDIIARNCLETLDQQSAGFRFYNRWQSNDHSMIDGSTTPTMSCILFNSLGYEDVTFSHALEDMPFFENVRDLRNQEEIYNFILDNSDSIQGEAQKLDTRISDRLTQMAAYNYIVRKAFSDSLAKELKRNADFQILADTRAKGWAGLGSMMIAISSEQAAAAGFASNLLETGMPSSYYRVEESETFGSVITAVNLDVFNFARDEDFIAITEQADINVAGIINTSSLVGLNSPASSAQSMSSGNMEMSMLQKMLVWLIEFVFNSPLTYLKQGSGMDVNKSLPENLADCSVSTNCFPSTTHPLNATIMFGQGLLANSFMAIIILTVLNAIAQIILGVETNQGGDKKKGNSSISSAKKLIGGTNPLIIIMKIIAYLVILIAPLLISLFTVMLLPAVMLGYILPIIPYLMTVMVILGWFITIFVKSIAFPIKLLLASKINENGQTQISLQFFWQSLGDILLKPSLITIAIIFAWILVNITIYFINTTMFSIFELTAFGGGIISNMVGIVIAYFIYSMVIYFALQHSFKIILKFSDEVFTMLNLNQSGDVSDYTNLGVEKMLAGQALASGLSKAAQSPEKGVSSLRDKIKAKANSGKSIGQGQAEQPHNNSASNQSQGNDKRENDRVKFD